MSGRCKVWGQGESVLASRTGSQPSPAEGQACLRPELIDDLRRGATLLWLLSTPGLSTFIYQRSLCPCLGRGHRTAVAAPLGPRCYVQLVEKTIKKGHESGLQILGGLPQRRGKAAFLSRCREEDAEQWPDIAAK